MSPTAAILMRFDARSLSGPATTCGSDAGTAGRVDGSGAAGGSSVSGCVAQPLTHKIMQTIVFLVTQTDSQDVYLRLVQSVAQ